VAPARGTKPASAADAGEPIDRLARTMSLDESVSTIRLVSPVRERALGKLGIRTVRDLLSHYPRRYIDMSQVRTVRDARIGDECTIRGSIHEMRLKRPRPNLPLVELSVVDDTGVLMITAFRQPWLMDQLKAGMQVAVSGKLEFNYGFKRMTNPFIEPVDENTATVGLIVPVHPATGALSTAWIRRLVSNALEQTRGLLDPLPLDLRLKRRLMSRQMALSCIHFPQSADEQRAARTRLAYEELLLLELVLMRENEQRAEEGAPTEHVVDGPRVQALAAAVPFELTDEQRAARDRILGEMAAPHPMNHLLLGDVGTGKTIVAAFALAAAADSGGQAVLMAPTEILARQHAQSLGSLFDQAGVTWAALTGSTDAAERERIVAGVAAGTIDVLIGTHAVLQDDVVLAHCTLAVIDEQQRFGVDQRAKLLSKGTCIDALYLTATPIPRSLALAVFGNLSLSYIKHRPHDSARRTTYVHDKRSRGKAYDAALAALKRGERVYVVCPLVGVERPTGKKKGSKKSAGGDEEEYAYASISIEDENDLDAGGCTVAAAESQADFLQKKVFVDYRVDLVHGRMSGADKRAVMERFASGESQVLVATTVIEVGVDVPQATVMIVEDADRFGLAQLHQLRGRVGRGELPAEVHLISGSRSDTALSRLEAMKKTDDGFKLAEYDLSLRREGDILGNRQHGASGLKLVNIVRDGALIEQAHADAQELLAQDPQLSEADHRALAREVRFVERRATVVAGG
jgi:ATP-dependent DNA helicase RecG